jgi:hypothetical protein
MDRRDFLLASAAALLLPAPAVVRFRCMCGKDAFARAEDVRSGAVRTCANPRAYGTEAGAR